jgi:predicted DCC family thiol-disulfide oxidoreductase YuxK
MNADTHQEQSTPSKPVLLYDGECRLCRGFAASATERFGGEVEVLPGQASAERGHDVSADQLARSVVLLDETGELHEGALALAHLLRLRGMRWPLWCYRHIPGLAPTAEWAYRLIARHRHRLGG